MRCISKLFLPATENGCVAFLELCVYPHLSGCGCRFPAPSLSTMVSEPVRWALRCTGGSRPAPNEPIWDRLGEECVFLLCLWPGGLELILLLRLCPFAFVIKPCCVWERPGAWADQKKLASESEHHKPFWHICTQSLAVCVFSVCLCAPASKSVSHITRQNTERSMESSVARLPVLVPCLHVYTHVGGVFWINVCW